MRNYPKVGDKVKVARILNTESESDGQAWLGLTGEIVTVFDEHAAEISTSRGQGVFHPDELEEV